jgi:hypothetical protein
MLSIVGMGVRGQALCVNTAIAYKINQSRYLHAWSLAAAWWHARMLFNPELVVRDFAC